MTISVLGTISMMDACVDAGYFIAQSDEESLNRAKQPKAISPSPVLTLADVRHGEWYDFHGTAMDSWSLGDVLIVNVYKVDFEGTGTTVIVFSGDLASTGQQLAITARYDKVAEVRTPTGLISAPIFDGAKIRIDN